MKLPHFFPYAFKETGMGGLGSGVNSSSANTATGPSDQVLIAGEQMQLQASLANQQSATQLAGLQIQAQEQGSHDALAAQLQESSIAANLEVAKAQINGQLQA